MNFSSAPRVFWFRAILTLVIATLGHVSSTSVFASETEVWSVIGQQGLVHFVLVPSEEATTLAAYEKQISRLCEPERTCFLNFYTNSTGAALVVPLPDAVANEATATYRRSMKNGIQVFLWSCRLNVPGRECF